MPTLRFTTLLAPLLLYPFTRTVWLAADLILDPQRPGDR